MAAEQDLLMTTNAAEISKSGKSFKVKAVKRWKWTDEMADHLIQVLANIKSEKEYAGKDFESDLVALYKEVRQRMALDFQRENFGPISLTEPPQEKMDNLTYGHFKLHLALEKKEIRTGYERIKEKIKDIRQDYRKAVSSSGSRPAQF